MYQIYLLIGIFIGLIIYQILNFYSIKEGLMIGGGIKLPTPNIPLPSSAQSPIEIPKYTNSTGGPIGEPNINTLLSPMQGHINNFYNAKIPVAKYNSVFKNNNFTYQRLIDAFNNSFFPDFFTNGIINDDQFNKFIQLDDDVIIWFIMNSGSWINKTNINAFLSLSSAQIRILTDGSSGEQQAAILNQPMTMILTFLSLSKSDRTLLLKLSGPEMTTVFNMPNKYILASYLLYYNTPSNANVTPLLSKINENINSLNNCNIQLTNYGNDNKVIDSNLSTCNLTKSSDLGNVQIANDSVKKQKQILGIN
jgi:hypothetical protein